MKMNRKKLAVAAGACALMTSGWGVTSRAATPCIDQVELGFNGAPLVAGARVILDSGRPGDRGGVTVQVAGEPVATRYFLADPSALQASGFAPPQPAMAGAAPSASPSIIGMIPTGAPSAIPGRAQAPGSAATQPGAAPANAPTNAPINLPAGMPGRPLGSASAMAAFAPSAAAAAPAAQLPAPQVPTAAGDSAPMMTMNAAGMPQAQAPALPPMAAPAQPPVTAPGASGAPAQQGGFRIAIPQRPGTPASAGGAPAGSSGVWCSRRLVQASAQDPSLIPDPQQPNPTCYTSLAQQPQAITLRDRRVGAVPQIAIGANGRPSLMFLFAGGSSGSTLGGAFLQLADASGAQAQVDVTFRPGGGMPARKPGNLSLINASLAPASSAPDLFSAPARTYDFAMGDSTKPDRCSDLTFAQTGSARPAAQRPQRGSGDLDAPAASRPASDRPAFVTPARLQPAAQATGSASSSGTASSGSAPAASPPALSDGPYSRGRPGA